MGFIGSRKEVTEIYNKVFSKLKELKLNRNIHKSSIRHGSFKNIKYLGIYINYYKSNKVEKK